MWIKVKSIEDLPLGMWLVYMEDGEYGYCEVHRAIGSNVAVINGAFYFDKPNVIAYTEFIKYEEEI